MTLLFAVLLTAAAPRPAAPAPVYTGTKLEQGQKAFSEGQFDVALKALDAAAAENPDAATMEKVQLLRGQCFAARGDFGHAEEAFAWALEANPEAALDPGKVDPAVVKLLESMRSRSSGSLTFRSKPLGAHVLVDGVDQGVAPLTVTAPIGRHKVEARWEEGQVAQLEVMVRSKRETFVDWVYEQKTVTVEKRVEVPVPVAPPPTPPQRFARPYGGLRFAADLNAGPEAGFDLAAGVEFKYLAIGLYFRPYRYVTVIPRVAGIWPIFDWVALSLEASIDARVLPGHFGLAFAVLAGAEVFPLPWLGIFAQAGFRDFFINQGFVVDARIVVTGGVRARLP